MIDETLLSSSKRDVHERLDGLNELLDQALSHFVLRFVRTAELCYDSPTGARFLVFKKSGNEYAFLDAVEGGALEPLQSKSMEVRLAAIPRLESLWELCLTLDDELSRQISFCEDYLEGFLKRRAV